MAGIDRWSDDISVLASKEVLMLHLAWLVITFMNATGNRHEKLIGPSDFVITGILHLSSVYTAITSIFISIDNVGLSPPCLLGLESLSQES